MSTKRSSTRNIIAFWIFGVCNNFAYYLMNSGAQDILHKQTHPVNSSNISLQVEETCEIELESRHCSPHSASVVLLCNILPGLIIKILYPIIANFVPYGVRHAIVFILQAISLVVVALANSVPLALLGVLIGSIQSGLGESTYLGLASHYSKETISFFSAGTGFAGLISSFTYAGLTDSHLVGLSSRDAMLVTLVVPISFCIAYYFVLERPETVHKVSILKPQSWIGLDKEKRASTSDSVIQMPMEKTFTEKVSITKSLLKYMLPLFFVYFSEYLINQGLIELVIFDCAHAFSTSLKAQYRWLQFIYQIGVFISRSSGNIIYLNMTWIAIMPVLQVPFIQAKNSFSQMINTVFFLFDSIFAFVPHFIIMAAIVLYEGLIGGGTYVHAYRHIHKNIDPAIKEFALSIVTLADTAGILAAALAAIPIHNAICSIPFYK